MTELVEVAQKTFLLALQNRVSCLLGTEIETPPNDLLPTPAANKVLALLGQLLSSDSSSEGKQSHISQVCLLLIFNDRFIVISLDPSLF